MEANNNNEASDLENTKGRFYEEKIGLSWDFCYYYFCCI